MTSPVLDREMLAQLRELGDAEFLGELVDIYVSDALPRIAAMREAAAAGDAASMASEAHALKSSSGNVAAASARDLCAALEAAARAGDLRDAPALLARIEDECARAVVELRKAAAGA